MSFTCDTCGKSYSNKRNLCRHIKEKHDDGLLHFKCTFPDCKSKFIRRSYLTKHFTVVHKMEKKDAKTAATDVVLQPERVPLTETGQFSPISDVTNDDAHPSQDASDNEFENWLDDIVLEPEAPIAEETIAATPEEDLPLFHEPTVDEMYDEAEEELRRRDDETDAVYISSDNEDTGATEEHVEYFNATLKTVTHIKNGQVCSVERVASVAYSPSFDPANQEPMDTFTRIQQEFVDYMRYYQSKN